MLATQIQIGQLSPQQRIDGVTGVMSGALGGMGKVVFSVITGGAVQKGGKTQGDIDILTIVPEVPSSIHPIIHLAKEQIQAQKTFGYKPDLDFQTDVITIHQLQDAVLGRALEIVDGKIVPKKFSDDEILSNTEADYLIWLFEMISHDFGSLGGNIFPLVRYTREALRTIFILANQHSDYTGEIDISSLARDLFTSVEVLKTRGYTLTPKLQKCLMKMLSFTGMGTPDEKKSGIITLHKGEIVRHTKYLHERITTNSFHAAHFYTWDQLRSGVKE